MKIEDLFPKHKPNQITLSGQPLMDFLERGRRREVFVYRMDRTSENGKYTLFYNESDNTNSPCRAGGDKG